MSPRPLAALALTGLCAAGCPFSPAIAPCSVDAECRASERCVGGRCLAATCGEYPCPTGQACLEGQCLAADCVAVTCAAGEACAGGKCYPRDCSSGPECVPTEVCAASACIASTCVGVQCAAGEVCAGGTCHPDACAGAVCVAGAACVSGRCESTRCVGVVCAPGLACVDGRCVPGACKAGQACDPAQCKDACCIGATAYAGGAADPMSACRECAPAKSTTAWSVRADGTACGAGQVCGAGACKAGCWIGGKLRASGEANPANPCEVCQPGASTSSWTALAEGAGCGAGLVCRAGTCQAGCGIGGASQASGEANPANACEACQPATATTSWTVRADGADCGSGQICHGGTCQAGCWIGATFSAAAAADPGNACRSCQPANSTSAWTPRPDGTGCGAGQVCSGGSCLAGCWIDGGYRASGETSPASPCASCQPGLSTTGWTNRPGGTGCGSGQVCDGATCKAGCWIGGSFRASGAANPANACERCVPGTSVTAWTPLPEGTGCALGAICHGGTCQPGCWISSTFYASGASNGGNACQTCAVDQSTTAWTNAPLHTSCGAGSQCAGGACLPNPVTFGFTGAAQTYTVPAGVAQLVIEAWGAAGSGAKGGKGGYAKATVPVTASTTLQVWVGGKGKVVSVVSGAPSSPAAGGWNGGGSGGGTDVSCTVYGAGGASDVRGGAFGLSDRLVVAGGGGGQGSTDPSGGDGVGPCGTVGSGGAGGQVAGAGTLGSGTAFAITAGSPGGGATVSSGGTAGAAGEYRVSTTTYPGYPGSAGLLGQGASGTGAWYCGGGGGGGGYFGGGSGGAPSANGGGGGSSWAVGGASNVSFASGIQAGDGTVVLTW